MNTFNIIVGCATIVGVVIALISLLKNSTEQKSNNSSQNITNATISNSNIHQVGRDNKEG